MAIESLIRNGTHSKLELDQQKINNFLNKNTKGTIEAAHKDDRSETSDEAAVKVSLFIAFN